MFNSSFSNFNFVQPSTITFNTDPPVENPTKHLLPQGLLNLEQLFMQNPMDFPIDYIVNLGNPPAAEPVVETAVSQDTTTNTDKDSSSKSTTTSQTTNQGTKKSTALSRMDIEDVLKGQGITSVNGKKIKFGKKTPRDKNAKFGAKNSWHKKADPHTGFAMARDISIIGGNDNDYAEFRRILLNNSTVRQYMAEKGWGIINEITPAILRRTRGTGKHFHFGPDTWARRTWNAWVSNPNISITKAI